MAHTFAVITQTDDRDMAIPAPLYVVTAPGDESTHYLPTHKPLHEVADDPRLILVLRQQVWTLGEIVVLDDNGREVDGARRKPSKWAVKYEEFSSIDAAIARAECVREEL